MCNLFVSECYLWKCATIQGDIGFKGLLESMEICYNTYFQCAINICSLYVIGITMFPWNKSTLYLFMAWHRYQRVIHEKQIPKVTPDSDSGNEMLFMTISYLASVCDTRIGIKELSMKISYFTSCKEEFGDTKVEIVIRKVKKNWQHNGRKKKDIQRPTKTHRNLKTEQHEPN